MVERLEVPAGERLPEAGRLLSVNVGTVRQIELAGTPRTTAIWKFPVAERVAVQGVNVAGDVQADLDNHGGPDQVLYAYAQEDYAWWEAELGRPLEPAMFGDNLTTAGIDVTGALVGEQWRIGSSVLRVTGPRTPCWKLGVRMEDSLFPRRFAAARRPGAYLGIVTEGEIGADDRIEVHRRPTHGVTVGLMFEAYHHDHGLAERILMAELPPSWRKWAQGQLKSTLSSDQP